MSDDNSYPLHWPTGWPRTAMPQRSKFGEHTQHQALEELQKQLAMLKATNVVISSNVTLGNRTPTDKGVCAYFKLRGKPYAMPCDKWASVTENLWALGKHIEALRGQERWGVSSIERAFTGYLALGDGKRTWRGVFGYTAAQTVTADELKERFRDLAVKCHPDHGGSADAMAELNSAYEAAKVEMLKRNG